MVKTTPVSVDSNIRVTNYKPAPNREQKREDLNITNEDGKINVPKQYNALFDALKALDGDSTTLSWSDGVLAKTLSGTNGISNVRMDSTAKVVTFVFENQSILRMDMGINDNKTIQSLQKEIANGNASYQSGVLNYLMQCITPHTPLKGDEIVLNTIPDDCETLGDVKAKYHLPDGCLKNNIFQGGGDLDTYKAIAPITIHVKTLAEGLGVTSEQIKELFN